MFQPKSEIESNWINLGHMTTLGPDGGERTVDQPGQYHVLIPGAGWRKMGSGDQLDQNSTCPIL